MLERDKRLVEQKRSKQLQIYFFLMSENCLWKLRTTAEAELLGKCVKHTRDLLNIINFNENKENKFSGLGNHNL